MRITTMAIGLIIAGAATAAGAMPMVDLPDTQPIVSVQLQCSPQSCIDPRTGVYTQSTCDRRGCRPSSGPVGRIGGGAPGYGGYDDGYDRRPRRRDWDDGSGGGMGCNASRCIDGSGRVWESTCDRRGCRPLRPARGSRW